MKKVLLFVAVVTAASFASCKKDRVCTCTSTSTFTGGGSSTSTSVVTSATIGLVTFSFSCLKLVVATLKTATSIIAIFQKNKHFD